MTDEYKGYKYTIPLEPITGVDRPLHDVNTNGDVYKVHYRSTNVVVVQSEATPHYHKDSVNVKVEEVDLEDYTDIDNLQDDDTSEDDSNTDEGEEDTESSTITLEDGDE